jgi:hypothetical protein
MKWVDVPYHLMLGHTIVGTFIRAHVVLANTLLTE